LKYSRILVLVTAWSLSVPAYAEVDDDEPIFETLHLTARTVLFSDDLELRLAHDELDLTLEKDVVLPALAAARQSGDAFREGQAMIILLGMNQRLFYAQYRTRPVPGYDAVEILNEINAKLLAVFPAFDPTRGVRFASWASSQGWQTPAKLRKKRVETRFVDDLLVDPDSKTSAELFLSDGNTTARDVESKENIRVLNIAYTTFRKRIESFIADPEQKLSLRQKALLEVVLFQYPHVTLSELAERIGYTRQNLDQSLNRLFKRIRTRWDTWKRGKTKYRASFLLYLDILQNHRLGMQPSRRTPRDQARVLLSPMLPAFEAVWRRPGFEPPPTQLEAYEKALRAGDIEMPESLRTPVELLLFHQPRLMTNEIGSVLGYSNQEAHRRLDRAEAFIQDEVIREVFRLVRAANLRIKRTAAERAAIRSSPRLLELQVAPKTIDRSDLFTRAVTLLPVNLAEIGLSTREAEVFHLYYRRRDNFSIRDISTRLGFKGVTPVSKALATATNKAIDWLVENDVVESRDLLAAAFATHRTTRKVVGKPRVEPKPEKPKLEHQLLNLAAYAQALQVANRLRIVLPDVPGLTDLQKSSFAWRYLETPPLPAGVIARSLQIHPKRMQRWIRAIDDPLVHHLLATGELPADQESVFRQVLAEFRDQAAGKRKPTTNLPQWLEQRIYWSQASNPFLGAANGNGKVEKKPRALRKKPRRIILPFRAGQRR
jgi:hypothetical protein